MHERELKQKIRNLKKLELRIRYGYSFDTVCKQTVTKQIESLPLIWKDFFGTSNINGKKSKYSFELLEDMTKDEIKKVFDEFWFHLYIRLYQEKGIAMVEFHQPELLNYLDLPLDADNHLIKKRFRELCKRLHPDVGGDKEKFIELMEVIESFERM